MDLDLIKLAITVPKQQATKLIYKHLRNLGMRRSLSHQISAAGATLAARQHGVSGPKKHLKIIQRLSKGKTPRHYKGLSKGETIYKFQQDFNRALTPKVAPKSKAKAAVTKATTSLRKPTPLALATLGTTGLAGFMMLKAGPTQQKQQKQQNQQTNLSPRAEMLRRLASNTRFSLDAQIEDAQARRAQLPFYYRNS